MKIGVKQTNVINGTVNISGSKNIALPIICGALLTKKKILIKNVPIIKDVLILIDILKDIGCNIKFDKNKKQLEIKTKKITSTILSKKVKELRGSYYLIGVLLSRYNKCIIKYPGGCNFTSRPIDYHIDSFKQLGYETKQINDLIIINKKNKFNNSITIKNKSVGASINTLFACALIEDRILINKILLEREVLETIYFLRQLGKEITILNDDQIIISNKINNESIEYIIPGDRIEAGSYMLLASAIEKSNIKIINAPIKYMCEVIKTVKKLGVEVIVEKNEINIIKFNKINNLSLEIFEYPSFPTDLQQILTVVLLKSNGVSNIKDNIYPYRISQLSEIQKMNAIVEHHNNTIKITPSELNGTLVISKDLRCAFALLVAGLISKGETLIDNFEIAFRGYENIIEKMKELGIDINVYY